MVFSKKISPYLRLILSNQTFEAVQTLKQLEVIKPQKHNLSDRISIFTDELILGTASKKYLKALLVQKTSSNHGACLPR